MATKVEEEKKRDKNKVKEKLKKTIEFVIVRMAIDRENKRRNRDGKRKWEIPFQTHNLID